MSSLRLLRYLLFKLLFNLNFCHIHNGIQFQTIFFFFFKLGFEFLFVNFVHASELIESFFKNFFKKKIQA